jgi:hypothetical protein
MVNTIRWLVVVALLLSGCIGTSSDDQSAANKSPTIDGQSQLTSVTFYVPEMNKRQKIL